VEHYRANKNDMCEAIEEIEDLDKLGLGFMSADHFEEIDIGDGVTCRPTFVNKNLSADYKNNLVEFLREYVDCFAWNYQEMPGLSRDQVEHRFPIKAGFGPFKQHERRYNPLMYDRIKEEIDQLLKANFIRPCGYAEWISNMVPVEYALILEISIELVLKMNILCLFLICLLMMLQDIKFLVFFMVMLVIIKFSWPRRICTKWPLDVLVLLAFLSGLS
jgi:hypothetical protein